MKTLNCWLIANSELVLSFLTVIIGGIAIWVYGAEVVANPENKVTSKGHFFGLFTLMVGLAFVIGLPTNRGALQFGRYILMLGGVIFVQCIKWESKSEASDSTYLNLFLSSFWTVFIVASVVSLLIAIYTFINFDEVTSRRMLWRNSNVSLFDVSILYTLDRFCNTTVSIVTSVFCLKGLFMLI
jgi:uncharacterized integral membrane protein